MQESNNNNQSENESSSEEVTPPKNQGLIKAKGTYFPLTAFPTSMPQVPNLISSTSFKGTKGPHIKSSSTGKRYAFDSIPTGFGGPAIAIRRGLPTDLDEVKDRGELLGLRGPHT